MAAQPENGDLLMRLLLAFTIAIMATVGLGGCFGHHQTATIVEPIATPPIK